MALRDDELVVRQQVWKGGSVLIQQCRDSGDAIRCVGGRMHDDICGAEGCQGFGGEFARVEEGSELRGRVLELELESGGGLFIVGASGESDVLNGRRFLLASDLQSGRVKLVDGDEAVEQRVLVEEHVFAIPEFDGGVGDREIVVGAIIYAVDDEEDGDGVAFLDDNSVGDLRVGEGSVEGEEASDEGGSAEEVLVVGGPVNGDGGASAIGFLARRAFVEVLVEFAIIGGDELEVGGRSWWCAEKRGCSR